MSFSGMEPLVVAPAETFRDYLSNRYIVHNLRFPRLPLQRRHIVHIPFPHQNHTRRICVHLWLSKSEAKEAFVSLVIFGKRKALWAC